MSNYFTLFIMHDLGFVYLIVEFILTVAVSNLFFSIYNVKQVLSKRNLS